MLRRALKSPTSTETTTHFRDVSPGGAHGEAITWMARQGLISGYADGTFRPSRLISRGEAALILHRHATQEDGMRSELTPVTTH